MKPKDPQRNISRKKPDDLSAAGLKRVLKDAGARVAKENLQQGIAITVIEHGQLVRISPNNTRRVFNKKPAPLVAISKTRFRLD